MSVGVGGREVKTTVRGEGPGIFSGLAQGQGRSSGLGIEQWQMGSLTFGTVGLVILATASFCTQCLGFGHGVSGALELPLGPYCKY